MKTENLQKELSLMQEKCIGLYYNPFMKTYNPVISETDFTFVVISIGCLLGLSTDHYSKNEDHKIIYFPDNKTLSELMENPMEFKHWYDENVNK